MRPTGPVTDRTRVRLTAAQHVRATPEEVFPLLCPVRELDFLPDWECRVVYTASGIAEEGCVFQTDRPSDGAADTWVVSRYEPPRRISFVRVNRLRTMIYDIRLAATGDGGTRLDWSQEVTALDDDGERYLAGLSQGAFQAMIREMEPMIEHYLRTGEALAVAAG